MKIEQLAFPLMISAAVVTLWLAFRKSAANAPVTTVAAQIAGLPALQPLQQFLAHVPDVSGAGQNFFYINAARQNPTSNNPASVNAPNPTNSYQTTNLPPWLNLSQMSDVAPVPVSTPSKAGGCGCGGGCNDGCAKRSDTTNRRYSDGRGGCTTARPQVAGASDPANVIFMNETGVYDNRYNSAVIDAWPKSA